ncbi:hypothetical protein M501DRAFT_1014944 [Patellaria atrata CBS 101060]|uniref:Heterokaryon incompatibility domain-containing protein n=1 Tax=Patellaria atrata CBS 101060 TaxID=1346257 RepID=A0A9P4SE74_9PEZI|nr:hypothetical protein M501DRAFT_1014944 [Patellaria atrata CBS 101060]
MEFNPCLLDLHQLDGLTKDIQAALGWKALADLMTRKWFSRRWIVQELWLVKTAFVHFETIKNEVFAKAVQSRYHRDAAMDIDALGASVLVKATRNLSRKSENGEILVYISTLETLVSALQFFEASDPRDIVYGVLAIASDTGYLRRPNPTVGHSLWPSPLFQITADYGEDVTEVFIDFPRFCIERSGATYDLLSWIGRLEDCPYGKSGDALVGRQNGDSLAGSSLRNCRKIYDVSKGRVADWKFGERGNGHVSGLFDTGGGFRLDPYMLNPGISSKRRKLSGYGTLYDGSLKVRGLTLGTIDSVSARVARGVIHKEALEMVGWYAEHPLDKVPDKLWRTLVADRDPKGDNPPSWYSRVCLFAFKECSSPGGDVSVDLERKDRSKNVHEFMQRVKSVVWNRTFFLAGVDNELYGLALAKAEEEDLVCILLGWSVSVILREHRDYKDPWYDFVGEAYVHGKMDGEAMTETSYQSEGWFTLR